MIGNEGGVENAKHILLIEDNPINRELVLDLLRAYGYRVSEAGNAVEAETRLAEGVPDLILMDLQLPGVDGLTLTKKLKSLEQLAGVPVVAVTAFAMRGDRERALAAGCAGVITKPIDTRAFPRQLEAYLMGYNEQEKDT